MDFPVSGGEVAVVASAIGRVCQPDKELRCLVTQDRKLPPDAHLMPYFA